MLHLATEAMRGKPDVPQTQDASPPPPASGPVPTAIDASPITSPLPSASLNLSQASAPDTSAAAAQQEQQQGTPSRGVAPVPVPDRAHALDAVSKLATSHELCTILFMDGKHQRGDLA